MHVYRWDLDRTYLDTSIDSVRGLLKTAMEDAADKRTLPGAGALLRGLQRVDPAAQICILSGSPTQLRTVLEAKLALDGIRFDTLILKDNLGNLRRGRLRALRGQVGYKLPALLRERVGLGPSVAETLFGDDSESDALIYVAYAEAIAGRLSPSALARVLEAGKAYDDHVDLALSALRKVGPADAVEDVFIRLDRRTPVDAFHLLGPLVKPVHDWLQAALVLHARGRLDDRALAEVARTVSERGLGVDAIASLFQDAVRRGLVARAHAEGAVDSEELAFAGPAVRRALRWTPDAPTLPEPLTEPDYFAFLRRIHDR